MPPQKLLLKGEEYTLLKRHRPENSVDSSIYVARGKYMRIGDPELISRNLELHRKFTAMGFPLPVLLDEGELNGERYFVEASLGEKNFRIIFAEEVAQAGEISESSFAQFLAVAEQYLSAQTKAGVEPDRQAFFEGIRVAELCNELPEYAEKIRERATEYLENLSMMPYVLTHGDLSPNNMFSAGIIDLEDSFPAPLGYDAITALVTADWYPATESFEFPVTPYHFTPQQRVVFLAMCDSMAERNGLGKISEYVTEFAFFRAIWLSEGMGTWPKTQRYRHGRFLHEYLDL